MGVKNTGTRDGNNVVLVFWKPASADGVSGTPNLQLVGFGRVELKRGKSGVVKVGVDVCKDLSVVDGEGKRKLVIGQHTLVVGSSSEHQVRHRFNMILAESEDEGGFSAM